MSFFKKLYKKLKDIILEPFKDLKTVDGLTEENLRAFLEQRGVSDLLLYRDYEEFDNGKGIYTIADGRKGIIFEITPPAFLGDFVEKEIQGFLSSIDIEGVILHFNTFVSSNIENQVNEFVKYHHCNVNVENKILLKSLILNRAEYLKRKTKESLIQGGDLRVKNFINTISILFPEDTKNERIFGFYDSVKGALQNFDPQNLPSDRLITILREVFHREKGIKDWSVDKNNMLQMNHQIVSGGVEVDTSKNFKGFIINKSTYAKTLTTKKFPQNISLYEYSNIFFEKTKNIMNHTIPGNFIVSLTIKLDNLEKVKEKAQKKAQADLKELYKLGSTLIDTRPDLKDRRGETKRTLEYLDKNEVPVPAMWSLTIFEDSVDKINEVVSATKLQFGKRGWDLVEESVNNIAFMSFLFGLPLQHHLEVEEFIKRFNILFRSNNASICPIISDAKGVGAKHMPQVTRAGQIMWYDPFTTNENMNVAAMGGSGSGKSFSFAEQIVMGLAAGHILRVIDNGRSYERLCDILGGQSIQFYPEEQICLNFFTHIVTTKKMIDGKLKEVIDEDMFASIIPVLGLMIGQNLTAKLKQEEMNENSKFYYSLFEKAISIAFERRGRDSNLEDVRDVLIEFQKNFKDKPNISESLTKIITSLYPYADKNGSYYEYFNGVNNIHFNSDFFLLELNELEKKGILMDLVLMLLTNQMFVEFYSDTSGRNKVFILDEAAIVFDNQILVSFLEGIFRRIRKYGGSATTITQSIKDYYKNPATVSLFENASFKYFLKQDEQILNDALNSNKISVNPFEETLMKSIKKTNFYAESYIKFDRSAAIGRLFVDSYSYYLYTTSQSDKNLIRSIQNEYKLDMNNTLKVCAIMRDKQLSKDEAIVELHKQKKNSISDEEKKILKNIIFMAIKDYSNVILYGQNIYDNLGDIKFTELFFKLKDSTNFYSPIEIIELAKAENIYFDLSKSIIKKQLEYISSHKGKYSINLYVEDLLEYSTIELLIKLKNEMKISDNRIIIEIPIKGKIKQEFLFKESIKTLKENGFEFSNDNLNTEFQFNSLVSFLDLIQYVKLSVQLLENDDNNINAMLFNMIKILADKSDINIIATHIDKENQLELVKNDFGITNFQGYFLDEPKQL